MPNTLLRLIAAWTVVVVSKAWAVGLQAKPSYTRQSLRQVMMEALSTSPEVLESLSKKIEAEQQVYRETKGLGPSVDISYTLGSRQDNTLTDSDGNPNPNTSTYNLQWLVKQPLFSGFSTLNTIRQRQHEKNTAIQSLAATQNKAGLGIITAYTNLYKNRRLLELSLQNVAMHRATLVKAKKRFRAGASDSSDVELASARLARAQTDLASTRRYLKESESEYTRVAGRLPPQKLFLPTPPSRALPHSLNQALQTAFVNNPSIQAQRERVRVSEYALAVQQSAYFPNISLNYSDTRSRGNSSFEGKAVDKRANIRVDYNLFKSGIDAENIAMSRQKLRQTRQTLATTLRKERALIANSWARILSSKENHHALIDEIKANGDVVTSYTTQFQLGKRSLINVLDMQAELYRSRTRLVNNDISLLVEYYALLAELGTLFDALPDE